MSDDVSAALLDVHGAAAHLGVSPETVRRMIRDGDLPAVRWAPNGRVAPNTPYRVRRVDLDAFIERLPAA